MTDTNRMPAMTAAEADLIDNYLACVDYLGRINPARGDHTYTALRAAQALVSRATALREALSMMFERGEWSIHGETMARSLRILDGERRTARIALPGSAGPPDAD
jgi:hypothetical protein